VAAAVHAKVKEMLKDPEIVAKLDALGAFPAELGQDGFTRKVQDETTRWTAFIRKAGIKGTD
jgi:tripartite-type tricarboxylate transporter receptor subunit TctC